MTITMEYNIADRSLYIIDDVVSPELAADWERFILQPHPPGNVQQDIGHDFMTDDKVLENYIVVHNEPTPEDDPILTDAFKALHTAMTETVPSGEYFVRKWYTNIMVPNSSPWVHRDSRYAPNESFTSLWYSHKNWHPNWGGETLFYHIDTTDAEFFNKSLKYNKETPDLHDKLNNMLCDCEITAVVPKPNRLVIFDSGILHSGRAPQTEITRLTTALKITSTKHV